MAYHSFGGEVEASNTPTIRRLTPSRRHQLPRITLYNFVRIHQTLKVTPAMAAAVTKRLWEMTDIVDVIDAWEVK
jgi:hypothetical protein